MAKPRIVSATFRVRGQKELLKELEQLAGKVKGEEIVSMLMDAGGAIADEARVRVPVRTGLLKSAIFVGRGDPFKDERGPSILVGVSSKRAPHYRLVELGTKYMPANPFFRNSVAAKKGAVGERIAAGVKALIAKYS